MSERARVFISRKISWELENPFRTGRDTSPDRTGSKSKCNVPNVSMDRTSLRFKDFRFSRFNLGHGATITIIRNMGNLLRNKIVKILKILLKILLLAEFRIVPDPGGIMLWRPLLV